MTASDRLFEEAQRLYSAGAFAPALQILKGMAPREGDAMLLAGVCLARLRRNEEAVETFRELLAHDPDCFEALTWMSALTKSPHAIEESLGYARQAIALRPDDATGYGALGAAYLAVRDGERAIEALSRAVEIAPDGAEHRHNLALAYLLVHRHVEAVAQLEQAIDLAPRSPESYLLLASTLSQFGRAGQAIEWLHRGIQHLPLNARLHSSMAGTLAALRNDEAAERHHRKALELSPEGRGNYATWLLNQGRFPEANAIFTTMAREDADPAYAYYGLAQGRKFTGSSEDDAFVLEADGLIQRGPLRPRSEMYLRYALGKAEEGRKDYEAAMGHYDEANRLAESIFHGHHPISPSRFAEESAAVRELYESIDQTDVEDETPIFIVGMIRSGTTLLDQIVSSHPQVASGGELRFWIEEVRRLIALGQSPSQKELQALATEYLGYSRLLAGPSARITDKMPLNFEFLGVIRAALPNARFLHIRRHPVDVALSIWTTFFGQGPLFAYDKRNIVAYYREYERTMSFWRQHVPQDRLFELDYEDLISEPEPVIREIIDFLGLSWDDACLRHDQNVGAINTPSRWQARQPIYRSSLERWKRYEPWLGEFAQLQTS